MNFSTIRCALLVILWVALYSLPFGGFGLVPALALGTCIGGLLTSASWSSAVVRFAVMRNSTRPPTWETAAKSLRGSFIPWVWPAYEIGSFLALAIFRPRDTLSAIRCS